MKVQLRFSRVFTGDQGVKWVEVFRGDRPIGHIQYRPGEWVGTHQLDNEITDGTSTFGDTLEEMKKRLREYEAERLDFAARERRGRAAD